MKLQNNSNKMKTDVYVSSLCNVKIIKERRRGNTTRIVNNVIELLFNKHTVNVEDHANNNLYRKKQVLNLIRNRLCRDFTLTKDSLNEVVKDGNILIALKH